MASSEHSMHPGYALENLPAPTEVSGVTAENFAEKVTDHYRPLVLRDFAAHWPLVQAAKQSLSAAAAYLTARCNNKPQKLVSLPADTDGRLFYNSSISGMNFSASQQPLNAAITTMLASNSDDSNRYCVQCVPVADNFSSLLTELTNPLLNPAPKPFIWLGTRVTVPAHFDEASNIAVVAAGKRRFTLFPPEQVTNLYVGPLDLTPAGQPISMVNLQQPDLQAHPLYAQAYQAGLSVELDAGDAIYIPSPWWHSVTSLADFNVLVNYWWSNAYVASALPLPMLLHAIQAFNHMAAGERQAWQHMLQHYLFNPDHPLAHIPENARGVQGNVTPQLAQGLHQWLAAQLNR
ncbi:Cupin-like domain-containing protein [Arsukibacterium tuosuense]|uniref:Cupin-like domain-containing protein n=1 Tax=Arsukibacterium tuosuense TaxID=1323745 RepID=A0A285ISC4_9GAMM|nr:cupin-like domain-containing protein [Arsukibacterium tuosuense]SNY49851.1 Cupin-like domain-containing protein [Arsukibacterium tuosuense]